MGVQHLFVQWLPFRLALIVGGQTGFLGARKRIQSKIRNYDTVFPYSQIQCYFQRYALAPSDVAHI